MKLSQELERVCTALEPIDPVYKKFRFSFVRTDKKAGDVLHPATELRYAHDLQTYDLGSVGLTECR